MKYDAELKFRLPADLKKQLIALKKQARVRDDSDICRLAVEEYVQNHDSSPNGNDGKALLHPIARSRASDLSAAGSITFTFDLDTLFYPADIAHVIGMSAPEINALKARGCKFYGKKTKIRWVREAINDSGC